MAKDAWRVRLFDLAAAGERDYAALNAFENRLRAEQLPDDPPIPLAEAIQGWQHIPKFMAVTQWVIWHPDGSAIVAAASTDVSHLSTNQHMAGFDIAVLPAFRRQELARSLLAPVVEVAQREDRRLLIGFTNERVPAGTAFMERMGASQGLASHENQLVLAELDKGLMQRWRAQAVERAPGFTLGLWIGPYPDDQIEAVVRLHEVMNTMPRDQLDVEDFHLTPEQVRQWEQTMTARGTERWTLYVVEEATGSLAGYTAVFWNANRPHLLYQGDTGVFPEYRNRGLGRWLKAAMIEKVLRDRPQVQFVRTSNADSNAAMLKINQEMGFRPYFAHTIWQVETQQAAAYLSGSRKVVSDAAS